jgi:hypothetical protein
MNSNRERAIELRKSGKNTPEIAAELGLSKERVCQYLRPLGLAKRHFNSERFREQILELNGRMSRNEIAEALDINVGAVADALGVAERGELAYRKACRLIGKVYPGSQLTVLSVEKHARGTSTRKCRVRCACGNEKDILLGNLKSGKTKGCGCLVAIMCYGHHKRQETPMNLDDCRLLRQQLEAKYQADLNAIDRVEEMLLAQQGLNEDGTVKNPVGARTRGKELKDRRKSLEAMKEGA